MQEYLLLYCPTHGTYLIMTIKHLEDTCYLDKLPVRMVVNPHSPVDIYPQDLLELYAEEALANIENYHYRPDAAWWFSPLHLVLKMRHGEAEFVVTALDIPHDYVVLAYEADCQEERLIVLNWAQTMKERRQKPLQCVTKR